MKKATMFLAFIAMVLVSGTAFAQNGSTSIRQEICGYVYNPCCDELIDVCVDAHFVVDKNGALKHLTYNGSGTGSNGTEYTFVANQNQHMNIQDNGAGNYTVTLSYKLKASNSDCSFTAHYTIHVTMNSNGTLTATVENLRLECENGTIL